MADVISADHGPIYGKRQNLIAEISRFQREFRNRPVAMLVESSMPAIEGNPFGLPSAFEIEYEPYVIPPGIEKVLVLSDLHIPFHSVPAITTALEFGRYRGVDCIVLNGDIADIYYGSRFAKDTDLPAIKDEIAMLKTLFAALRKTFKDALILYKLGNHDERFTTNLLNKAPEYGNIEGFTLPEMARCASYGVEPVEDKRVIKAGRLPIYHGHEFPGGGAGGVNPARSLFLKILISGLCSHYHRSSEHSENDGDRKTISTWSTGCLCQLNPEYARNNKWNQGFALVEIDGEGKFMVSNKRIINGVAY